MPMELKDEAGNKVVLPVDKVEDIIALQETAKSIDGLKTDLAKAQDNLKKASEGGEKGIPAMRRHIEKLEIALKAKGEKVEPMQEDAPAAITPEAVTETANQVFEKKEAEKVEQRRQTILADLSAGDDNRKKVIDEQFKRLSGGKVITDHEEMAAIMNDAAYLANRTRSNGQGTPAERVANGGDPSGAPTRSTSSASKERGSQIAEAFGYKFKGDKSRLINNN